MEPAESDRQMRGERALVVSDVHLTPRDPETVHLFLQFLRTEAEGAGALHIIGDLFDFWLGRKQATMPGYAPILSALARLAEGGTEVTFLPGNRDFALGAETLGSRGVRVLPDVAEVRFGPRRVILTHGDLLCTRDHRYHQMRRVIRSRPALSILEALPRGVAMRLAGGFRKASGVEIEAKSRYVLDPDFEEARRWLEKGFDALIFGHVHTGEHYRVDLEDRTADIVVLPSWQDQPGFALWDGEAIRLQRFTG